MATSRMAPVEPIETRWRLLETLEMLETSLMAPVEPIERCPAFTEPLAPA